MLRSIAVFTGAILVFGALAGRASAETTNPLQWLFGTKAPQAAPEPAVPAPAPAPAPAAAPRGPAAAGRTAAPAEAVTVLPPRRPASLPGAPAEQGPPTPRAAAAAPQPAAPTATASLAPAAQDGPLGERQIVERANAYFNGVSTLVGDFVQTGGDGRRLAGKLYLQRPGRIRFEYDAPATIEVVADGTSVAVRNRRLATQDLYPIGQTPLKFLLSDRIDLGRDVRITSAAVEPEAVRVSVEDRSTLGGTSKITLFFDKEVENLTRWRIVDPQGFTTIVALSNLEKARRVDPRLFVINYERMLDDKR